MVGVAALIFGIHVVAAHADPIPSQHACAANDGHCQASTLLQSRFHGSKVNLDAGLAAGDKEEAGQHSQHNESLKAASGRSRSDDAFFLIHATFGPTPDSLTEISGKTYDAWILEQMALPAEFHRPYYRERVNSRINPGVVTSSRVAPLTTPCTAGSMWHRHAITSNDRGLPVVVDGSTIMIDGLFRSNIDVGYTKNGLKAPDTCTTLTPPWRTTCYQDNLYWACMYDSWITGAYCEHDCFMAGRGYGDLDCSPGWPSLHFTGFICEVEDFVGGQVIMDVSSDCKGITNNKAKLFTVMKNPAIYVTDSTAISSSTGTFSSSNFSSDMLVLDTPPASCAHASFIETGGSHYKHYPRFELLANEAASVTDVGEICASPVRSFTNEDTCIVHPHTCKDKNMNIQHRALLCGSPGEVASAPKLGHHYSWQLSDSPYYSDKRTEVPFASNPSTRYSKETVWVMKALKGNDQLRQRMAWALSQILVVGIPNFGDSSSNEFWINYYDIFVRHAFGNYRDVLREVSYNALMGKYLSFTGSYSFDSSGTYADENYAREIMQLFSIGLWQLNADGTHQIDANGESIPTYSNFDIMDFARVFTGFVRQDSRTNVEDENDLGENRIDPMKMRADKHDVYPKMNLYGGYIGDGYPLCSEMPALKFLETGARYEFVATEGTVTDLEVMVLSSSSPLYSALCGGQAPCNFQPTVLLGSTLSCDGVECSASASTLGLVKVDTGYYTYITPPCVYLYFYPEGRVINRQDRSFTSTSYKHCVNPALPLAGAICCAGCSDRAPQWMIDGGTNCSDRSDSYFFSRCVNRSGWVSNQYCQKRCDSVGAGYRDCSDGDYREQRMCSFPRERMTLAQAKSVCQSTNNMDICYKRTKPNGDSCLFEASSEMDIWTPEICDAPEILINAAGLVASTEDAKTEVNFIRVAWTGGNFPTVAAGNAPAECEIATDGVSLRCPIEVAVKPVFSTVPSPEQVTSQLFIAAFAPNQTCTDCAGPVKAYSASGSIDVDTVFEVDGRYFKNSLSEVSIGGNFTFRNAPHFVLAWFKSQAAALHEVEALLDHLAYHPNIAPFIARRVIQRFTTSTPSPAYVEAVANAYKTGSYSGKDFSLKHGDLAATIYAVLLHPEARGTSSNETTTGLLREPVLKLMHILRSLDYVDLENREIFMHEMWIKLGQWPYAAGRVFNFYLVDFKPAETIADIYGPEFEIFTAPFALGFANGVLELIEDGLAKCGDGFGMSVTRCGDPRYKNGQLNFTEAATLAETLDELNVLLTGGRIGASAAAIREAYENATAGEKLQAAQKAILMSPEFHTLGATTTNGERSKPPEPETTKPGCAEETTTTAAPTADDSDYKALIMLYLKGGQDSFNMFIPLGCNLTQEYIDARTTVGLDPNVLSQTTISASGQPCASFGIHPELLEFKKLYDEGDLAFVSNIGSLLEPTTMEQYKGDGARLCSGLFSHSDQWQATHSMKCQVTSAKSGFGGLIADVLSEKNYSTATYSIAGLTLWPQGLHSRPMIIDDRKGAMTFKDYAANEALIWNLTKHKYANAYADAYSTKVWDIVESMKSLNSILATANITQDFSTSSDSLMKQFHQVARIMSTRKVRGAQRELFYVEMGGFDAHSDGGLDDLGEKYKVISKAVSTFVQEMKDQGIWNNVTIMSGSDFGRTLTTNGVGTDHAWAGNGFILGGSVNGGQIYNKFPSSLREGGAQDIGRGRLLPEFPLESIYVPATEWFGIQDQADLDYIFPNLKNFDRLTDILSVDTLFGSGVV